MSDPDAVVVGSGPNGLVGAVLLAEAGLRVLVLEAGAVAGGGMRTEELTLPGFRHDVCSSVHPLGVASPAFRALGLGHEGLAFAHPEIPLAHPLDGDRPGLLHRDLAATVADLADEGPAWKRLIGPSVRAGLPLVDTMLSPLSRPAAPLAAARYGLTGILPATTVARTRLRGPRSRALLAGLAAHSMLDLHAPITSGYGLLLGALGHQVGWPVAVGGSQSIADALVARLRARGGEIVTGHRVEHLADLPRTRITLLDITPRQLLALADGRLPERYARALTRYRYGPGVHKVDWALDGAVPWRNPEVGLAATVHLGGPVEQVAQAERDVARGRHPDRPFVLFVQASVADATRAPAGKQTAWAYCHVPHGSTAAMLPRIEEQIERFAPGFRARVMSRSVRTPADIERSNPNLVGGDIGAGISDLPQLAARPTFRAYSTPVRGLYICSASTPPGVGVHGMCGYHAARRALHETFGA